MFKSNDDGSYDAQQADAVVVEEDKHATGRVVFHTMEQEQDSESIPFVKGEVQPLEYRDVNYARAFYLQFVSVILLAVIYGPATFKNSDADNESSQTDSEEDDSFLSTLLAIIVVSLLAATVGTTGFLALMMHHTESILKVSFFTAPGLLLAFGLVLFVVDPDAETNKDQYDPNQDNVSVGSVVLIQAGVFAAISACVYYVYRRFIPFAVSTLKVASMAVRANRGLYLLTAFMPFALTGWFLLWAFALMGVIASADTGSNTSGADEWTDDNDNQGSGPNGLAILVLIFAFYWTRYVIINVFHTTTAGTVGAWWFTPLADPSLCSMDVLDSLRRSLTYSFGSICFGSLVVAIIQTLEHMARSARRNQRAALLACVLECILHFIRRWVEYFNSWAFCYVGLYGYDFMTAGRNVVSLFTNKGWSTFASDRLVFRVLYFANLGVAILSGGAACLVDVVAGPLLPAEDTSSTTTSTSSSFQSSSSVTTNDDMDDLSASRWMAFFIGFLLGAALSHTAIFVMESAVRTVIVCFAESPAEFQECHPELCQLLRDGWAEAYPDPWAAAPIVWASPGSDSGVVASQSKVATATMIPQGGTSLLGGSGVPTDAFPVEKRDGLFHD